MSQVSTGGYRGLGRASGPMGQGRIDALAIVAVALLIGAPAIFTHHSFAPDYVNHLWLVSVQEHAISAHLSPTFFINAPANGVFYPFFLYYGATLYGLAGALAALLGGDVRLAYDLIILAAIACAYGGMLWLARLVGVRGWRAHLPALVFVSSAYYVTNIYGRGAWPELVGTSVWPVVCASGLSVLRSPRMTTRTGAAFVASLAIVAGSHNITLAMGTVTIAVVAGLLLIALGRSALPPLRRVLVLSVLAGVALGLDAWFLVPDLAHESDTAVSTAALYPAQVTAFLNTPGNVLDPWRFSPPITGNPTLFVQIPVLFLGWTLLAAALLIRRAAGRLGVAGILVALFTGAMLTAITVAAVWNALPSFIRDAQFPYRLNTYVTFAIAGLVIIACLIWQRVPAIAWRDNLLRLSLVLVLGVSLAACAWQLWVPHFPDPYGNIALAPTGAHGNPITWYEPGNYHNVTQGLVPVAKGRRLTIAPRRINADSVTLTVTPPPGTAPFITNIGGGPEAVDVTGGVRELGRGVGNYEVLQRIAPGSGPVQIHLQDAAGSILIGRVMTYIALAACVLLLGWGIERRRRGAAAQPS